MHYARKGILLQCRFEGHDEFMEKSNDTIASLHHDELERMKRGHISTMKVLCLLQVDLPAGLVEAS